jgi:hypothetical protein
MASVGTVPLLAEIPSPLIEPLAGRKVPANAPLPRTASAALTTLMIGIITHVFAAQKDSIEG